MVDDLYARKSSVTLRTKDTKSRRKKFAGGSQTSSTMCTTHSPFMHRLLAACAFILPRLYTLNLSADVPLENPPTNLKRTDKLNE